MLYNQNVRQYNNKSFVLGLFHWKKWAHCFMFMNYLRMQKIQLCLNKIKMNDWNQNRTFSLPTHRLWQLGHWPQPSHFGAPRISLREETNSGLPPKRPTFVSHVKSKFNVENSKQCFFPGKIQRIKLQLEGLVHHFGTSLSLKLRKFKWMMHIVQ